MDDSSLIGFILILLVIAGPVFLVLFMRAKLRQKRMAKELTETTTALNRTKEQLESVTAEFSQHKEKTAHLQQYEAIDDAKAEAGNILNKARALLERADHDYQAKMADAEAAASEELQGARAKAKEIRERADEKLAEAHDIAGRIENQAKERAEEIAGEAWQAKRDAEQYSATVTAMKNIIKGYGDEYLIPNESVLDELAEEYDHKTAGQELKAIRQQLKSMIKSGEVADCDYVEPSRRSTAIEFVVDAFNGKVDTIMSKVKHDNYGKLLQQLEDAFRIVNHNGKPFRDARIRARYYDTVVQQLKLAVAVQELKRQDLEEQRQIKEEMREEERARREYEKARKEAEKEERMLQKAMKEAEAKLAGAAAEERAKLEKQLEELHAKLAEAEAKGERAMSMAQQTKQGHVYVISNVGSFGEDVFKIGLTRRLEPLERIKELGDASVPFSFDVHAMIHSDDAPRLEKELHAVFSEHQMNKVNSRKEFFQVGLGQIKEQVAALGLDTHWTMKAEALEYRESQAIARSLVLRSPVESTTRSGH